MLGEQVTGVNARALLWSLSFSYCSTYKYKVHINIHVLRKDNQVVIQMHIYTYQIYRQVLHIKCIYIHIKKAAQMLCCSNEHEGDPSSETLPHRRKRLECVSWSASLSSSST
jgi:hypothetical protein